MSEPIDFVKGHCGWDVVTLIPEGQVPAGEELTSALKILDEPINGGLEVGFLGRLQGERNYSLRMASNTARDWVSMCGGMTQVIGKALFETSLRDRFGLDPTSDRCSVQLQTQSGEIPLDISLSGGRVTQVTTGMRNYVASLYCEGVEAMEIDGVPLLRVGGYAVFDVAALQARFAGLDFTDRRFGPALHAVNALLIEYGRRSGQAGVTAMLYDDQAEEGGQYRLYPRFWSEDLAAARCPWEFQCGTGSIAVALALHREGKVAASARSELIFEWGNRRVTPDPYGVRLSRIGIETDRAQVTDAAFSHSTIEIIAEGKIRLPQYVAEEPSWH